MKGRRTGICRRDEAGKVPVVQGRGGEPGPVHGLQELGKARHLTLRSLQFLLLTSNQRAMPRSWPLFVGDGHRARKVCLLSAAAPVCPFLPHVLSALVSASRSSFLLSDSELA